MASELVALHMYSAEKKGRVGLNSNVLFAVSPVPVDIETPSSVPWMIVRDESISTLYHVKRGLGIAIAVHTNMATFGCVTVIS